MRARNWLTSLAAPLVAAIAVGVAGVVVLGANNGRQRRRPLRAGGRIPARPVGGGRFQRRHGRPVEVSAIAAAGRTEVAVGSANRGSALWVSADGGSTWRRAAARAPAPRPTGSWPGWRTAPSGWLAVGGGLGGEAGAGRRPARP